MGESRSLKIISKSIFSTFEVQAASNHASASFEPIINSVDNVTQQRLQQLDALRAFRLTRDPGNSFAIDMRSHSRSSEKVEGSSVPNATLQIQAAFLNSHAANVAPFVDHVVERIDKWIDNSLAHNAESFHNKDAYYVHEAKTLKTFKTDIREFRAKAHERGLLTADVEKTLYQIDRLMRGGAGTSESAFMMHLLAEQIMSHATHPTSIEQGEHNTCTVAAVESRDFTRNPGEAAKLVVDVALTGKYFTAEKFAGPDGKMSPLEIDMQPVPDKEANLLADSGVRDFASQIFQTVAMNVAYSLNNRLNGHHGAYEQGTPNSGGRSDTGERIIDTLSFKPLVPEIREPKLSEDKLGVIIDATTGTSHGNDMVLVHENYRSRGDKSHSTGFESIEEFEAALVKIKDRHEFPVILKVNCMCEPFYTDANIRNSDGSGAAHTVTITDYDPIRKVVAVDNEWGDSVDHGGKNPIRLEELYVATQNDQGAEETLEKMITEDKRRGRIDSQKNLQRVRLAHRVKVLQSMAI